MAILKAVNGSIEFYSRYDVDLVGGVKMLPYAERKWEPSKKCWIVAMQHKDYLIKLCDNVLGHPPSLQGQFTLDKTKHTKLFRVEYIGGLKDRGDGKLSAMGAVQGSQKPLFGDDIQSLDWSILFYESVLRDYFEGDDSKESVVMTTLYSKLALKRTATQNEIKLAWRKMVKRYHPDINKDDDAAEMSIAINHAYEVLRNPATRKKYDAGLTLQLAAQKDPFNQFKSMTQYWKPPIRCGLIMADGYYEVGRFVVEKILQWTDIVENGRTLVTSWDVGTNSLIRNWI